MNPLTQQLRFSERAQRPTRAYFIAGSDPADWLDEIVQWQVQQDELRLYPIPRSRVDNRCLGVLVTYPDTVHPHAGAQSHPYGCLVSRLFLPVEALFSIDLREAEWDTLTDSPNSHYVWHPQSGLIIYDQHEILRIADLLSPPGEISQEDDFWGYAVNGLSFPGRLMSLRATLPSSIDQFMTEGRGDIGTRAQELGQPTGPMSSVLASAGSAATSLAMMPFSVLSQLFSKLIKRNPGTGAAGLPTAAAGAGPPLSPWAVGASGLLFAGALAAVAMSGTATLAGVIGGMAALGAISALMGTSGNSQGTIAAGTGMGAGAGNFDGVGSRIGAAMHRHLQDLLNWSRELFNARSKEINRLMKLLESDPDEGLKFALPMHGNPGRGIAAPSSSLLSRNVDFSLGRVVGGSGPADLWNLSPETQLQLMQRYRDLALREVQLGRHRRAAYIYAELLGDLVTAATTLVNGRYFREAAILYRDKLNRPLEAAKCLEEGGLLQEAIPLYHQLQMHEKVGDLHRRLQEQELADEAYQLAVSSARQTRDYLTASRILFEKLEAPDDALAVLDSAWENSIQARLALEKSFELLGKLGAHEQTQQRIAKLNQTTLNESRTTDLVEVLTRLTNSTAHQGTRILAADVVRQQASRALRNGHPNRQLLTSAVSRVAPQDKLLQRDCDRYLAGGKPTLATTSPPGRTIKIIRGKCYQLPADVEWLTACENDRNFYVVGVRDGEMIACRGAWHDPQCRVTTITWLVAVGTENQVLICPYALQSMIMVYVVSDDFPVVLPMQEFPSNDFNPQREQIGTPPWMGLELSALGAFQNGTIWTFRLLSMQVQAFDLMRQPVSYWKIPVEPITLSSPCEPIPMILKEDFQYFALGHTLVEMKQQNKTFEITLPQLIHGLVASPPNMERRLLARLWDGAVLIWNSLAENQRQSIGAGIHHPHAVFLRDGRLILHGSGKWEVYSTTVTGARLLHSVACDQQVEAIGLLQASHSKQVGLCTKDGKVTVYRLE